MTDPVNVLSPLRALLDLQSSAFRGTTWLALGLAVAAADTASLLLLNRSLAGWLQLPAGTLLSQLQALSPWQWFQLSVSGLVAWFICAPTLLAMWRHCLYLLRLYLPAWVSDRPYPLPSKGWRWLPLVEQQAAINNNSVLLAYCQQRWEASRKRDFVLQCTLSLVVVGTTGFALQNPASGLSLAGAALAWFHELSLVLQMLALMFIVAPVGLLAFLVLTDSGYEFGSHIQLPSEPETRNVRQ